ncbi:MAG: hypothetical protein Kow00121_62630 [Elainellaceae cyanobacterium]
MRAIEERILLLQEMEQTARAHHDLSAAQQYAEQICVTEQWVQSIRELVLSDNLFKPINTHANPSNSAD